MPKRAPDRSDFALRLGCVARESATDPNAPIQNRPGHDETAPAYSPCAWRSGDQSRRHPACRAHPHLPRLARRVACETRHDYIQYPYSASDGLKTMKLKQRLHDGDRSHPSIVALDETKASLSYPGWRSDAANAEMVWGFGMFCHHLPRHIDVSVAKMKRKQEYHEALPPNVLTAVCRSGASQVDSWTYRASASAICRPCA